MHNEEINELSLYRLEQSKENIEEAEVLYNSKKYKGASNRAYYAIFHAVKAILALEHIDFKKHSSVIAYFNKEYVAKGKFDKEIGRSISEARFYREKSDYVDFYIITKEECLNQIEAARKIVNVVIEYLMNYK